VPVTEATVAGNDDLGNATPLSEDEAAAEYEQWYRLLIKGQPQHNELVIDDPAQTASRDEWQVSGGSYSTNCLDFGNAHQIGLQHQQQMAELDAAAEASLAAAVAAVTAAAAAGDAAAAAVLNGAVDEGEESIAAMLEEVRYLLEQEGGGAQTVCPVQQQSAAAAAMD
jgi:hypothetical protein